MESTSFELITKKDEGKRPTKKSRKSPAAEPRQPDDEDAGEGPSGSTAGTRGLEMWTAGEGSVGAPIEEQPQSRQTKFSWHDILNPAEP